MVKTLFLNKNSITIVIVLLFDDPNDIQNWRVLNDIVIIQAFNVNKYISMDGTQN